MYIAAANPVAINLRRSTLALRCSNVREPTLTDESTSIPRCTRHSGLIVLVSHLNHRAHSTCQHSSTDGHEEDERAVSRTIGLPQPFPPQKRDSPSPGGGSALRQRWARSSFTKCKRRRHVARARRTPFAFPFTRRVYVLAFCSLRNTAVQGDSSP